MVVRIVASVLALGGVLTVDGERLVCRLPAGQQLPRDLAENIAAEKSAIMSCITFAPLFATSAAILALSEPKKAEYTALLVHDLAAWAQAESELPEVNQPETVEAT